MRGEIYEADDLVPAVRVSDGRRVRVPAAWLEEGHVFGGTYRKPEDEAEAAPEAVPEAEAVEESKPKSRARRASDT